MEEKKGLERGKEEESKKTAGMRKKKADLQGPAVQRSPETVKKEVGKQERLRD